ncbi:MAG TPA: DUF1844 domain-containing protein [Candidatus Mcinerneyibacteriales bacterium]|nr:DUF1844 domain-containing protein [Candidatus Mcinerneyibacteriales bacterium]HPE20520.1 DUF1844 domain-containing protein [Candidatus Mcinerneyibacteriales bacterium]
MDFKEYIAFLSTNALLGLGLVENPVTGKKEKNASLVRFTIEILDMLKEKTKGNLDDEEKKMLDATTANLKFQFLEMQKEPGTETSQGDEKRDGEKTT